MARITRVRNPGVSSVSEPVEELILEARQGDGLAARKLMYTLMEDMGRYTCATFGAIISTLREDTVKRLIELHGVDSLPEDLAEAKTDGIMALSGVYMVSLGCQLRPEEKEPTVALLHDKLTTILTWMLINLGHRPECIDTSEEYDPNDVACMMISGALRGLMDLDPSLEAAIVSNPVGVDIALALWTPLDKDSKPLFLSRQRSLHPDAGCAIMDTMLKFVKGTKAGRPALILQRILEDSAPCDEDVFVHRLFGRCILLQMMVPAVQETRQYCSLLQSCRTMIGLNQCLLVEHPDIFRKSIDDFNPVYWYCRALSSLARAKIEDDLKNPFLERVIDLLLFVYSEWVLRTPHLFFLKMGQALGDYGILEAIAVSLVKKDVSPAVIEKLNNLVDLVKGSLMFPTAGKCLPKQIFYNTDWTPQGPQPHRGVKVPLVEVRNEMLAIRIDMGAHFRKIPHKFPLCDNLEHYTRKHPSLIDSKACSHCQSVVYCSMLCQKQDWDARHRHECERSHRIYRDQVVEERRYRQKLRTHHLALAVTCFCESLKGQHGPALAEHAAPSLPSVAVVDMRKYPFTSKAVTLEKYVPDTKLKISKRLQKRFHELVKQALAEENDNEPTCFRMIHGVIRFGREEVFVTGTLTMKDTKDFRGVRVLNSMVSSRWLTEEEVPPVPVPLFEPFDLPSDFQSF